MGKHITNSTRMKSAGNMPKLIEEFIGLANTDNPRISIAKMQCPKGWIEPGQTPEFDEYTIVLQGCLNVKTRYDTYEVCEGEAFVAERNEWVQYSAPDSETEYLAICIPAFSNETVHRD